MKLTAPAKLNHCLFLGGLRNDGLHELRSVFRPVALADSITVSIRPDAGLSLSTSLLPGVLPEIGPIVPLRESTDEVVCTAVPGPNLVEVALDRLRERGWDAPPLKFVIEKRIPIAAGLGGGSADAAAVLRFARDKGASDVEEIAVEIGADVVSQLDPTPMLVAGSGEVTRPLPGLPGFAVVLIAGFEGLSTAAVYAEADRLGLGRDASELDTIEADLAASLVPGATGLPASLMRNDLGEAAISLRPQITEAIDALDRAGSLASLVTGSGPTVFGIFATDAVAEAAAAEIEARGGFDSVILTRALGSDEDWRRA